MHNFRSLQIFTIGDWPRNARSGPLLELLGGDLINGLVSPCEELDFGLVLCKVDEGRTISFSHGVGLGKVKSPQGTHISL